MPERIAFVRFRRLLFAHELDRTPFETVTMHIKAKAVLVKTGTLVDAAIITSASEDDDDARWVKRKGRRAVHGFKVYVGADADTALVEELPVTSANINDGTAGPEALPDNPCEMFADSACRGNHFRDAVRAKGGIPRIVVTGMWGRDEQEIPRKLLEWDRPVHRVRGRIKKIFGTWKRCYGLPNSMARPRQSRRLSPPRSQRLRPQAHHGYSRRSSMKIAPVGPRRRQTESGVTKTTHFQSAKPARAQVS